MVMAKTCKEPGCGQNTGPIPGKPGEFFDFCGAHAPKKDSQPKAPQFEVKIGYQEHIALNADKKNFDIILVLSISNGNEVKDRCPVKLTRNGINFPDNNARSTDVWGECTINFKLPIADKGKEVVLVAQARFPKKVQNKDVEGIGRETIRFNLPEELTKKSATTTKKKVSCSHCNKTGMCEADSTIGHNHSCKKCLSEAKSTNQFATVKCSFCS
jgi:hypothetical protein